MDRGVWQATVHGVTKSRARPSNFTSLQWNVNIEKRLADLGEGAGRKDGETHGESNMGTYTLLCNLDSQCEFAVKFRKLKPGLYNNLEEWDWVAGGREVQEGGNTCIPMADSC